MALVIEHPLTCECARWLALVVRHSKVDVVVFDPERDRRISTSRIVETGYWLHDHKVTVEIVRGVVRVFFIHPAPGDGPSGRDQRVPLDDADPETVAGMVRRGIEAGRTPF